MTVQVTAPRRRALGGAATWRDYAALTKPRIMSLLLLTAVSGAIAGAHGLPAAGTLLAVILGGAMAAGGASALNHVLDRDIDRLMGARTACRPVASGRLSAGRALAFGLALTVLSVAVFALMANPLAAGLSLAGGAFYVLVYTLWLKRSTTQNIVIGGAAGAVPPVVGWAASTGRVSVQALVLFAIVALWTPPHFWALALLIGPGYRAANVPMLPLVRGERHTTRRIFAYSIALTLATVAPVPWGAFGVVYGVAALALGAAFLYFARELDRDTTPRHAARLFHYSLVYLAVLFIAVALDASI